MISVILPVRGEPPPPAELLAPLREGEARREVLVAADPETSVATLERYREAGARVLVGDGPRGQRLRAAAEEAAGDVLLFLHADTRLPVGWAQAVESALARGSLAGAFRLSFSGSSRRMAWVAWWANLRTRLTRVPYGDQAPFVRKDAYFAAGGHPPWPLMEDVALGRRLRRLGRIALLPNPIVTSPRRYLARGVLRTVLANWRTLLRWRLGTSVERLAEEYRR